MGSIFKKRDGDIYKDVKNRDVYNSQTLERGERVKSVSAKGRMWTAGLICVFIFVMTWSIITLGTMVYHRVGSGLHLVKYSGPMTFGGSLFQYGLIKFVASFLLTLLIGGVVAAKLWRNYEAQNARNDHTDINTYENDQHVALPMEVMTKFDWFPDVGAHASPQVSSMISHVALSNKGIDKVDAAQFHTEDDEKATNGEVLAGEHKLDENGDVIFETKPFFDKEFANALFEASGITDELKKYKKYYDTTKIPYLPKAPRDAVGGGKYKTVADFINADWELPYYEPQRPAGAYIIDTAPVNTMV